MRRPLLHVSTLALTLAACGDDGTAETTDTATAGTTVGTAGTAGTTSATSAGTTTATSAGTETGTSASTSGPGTTDATTAGPGTSGTDATSTSASTTDPSTSGTTTDGTSTGTTDASTTGMVCPDGTVLCEAGESKTCDGMGGFKNVETCPDECLDGVGCVLCIPDSYKCEGENSLHCNDQGDAWEPYETCDGLQGTMCDANLGKCFGACTKDLLGYSYIGCDYYAAVTPQYPGYQQAPHKFAVAISNTTAAAATITITRGANVVTTDTVQPSTVKTITLPWLNELSAMDGVSKVVVDGAYRVRSTQPVNVYQYNPLEATVTNDASLLVPANAWTGSYLIASWQHWDLVNRPGFYSVIAAENDTTVTFLPSKTGNKVGAGAGVNADGTGMVKLGASDILMVRSATGGDLTGTIVHSDKPVAVISGHPCTNVPLTDSACDHLEESMFPIETLAKDYIVVPPAQVPDDTKPKAEMVRVIASEDNTTLTYTPNQPAATTLAKAGDFIELPKTVAAFRITADKKIAVGQYMVGQSAGFGTSDPAMLMSVAVEQYRKTYLFHAPPTWSANYVDIIAPDGTAVKVDGQNVANFTSIPGTGFGYTHVKLSNAGDGTHTVSADKEVGISVYGVLNYGSYWYPGGLDLNLIPQ